MDGVIAEIKRKLDIVEFIGAYVPLKKAGKHYTGLCPFHQEKSPSFVVSPDREMWYCFGACHEGGDIFNFIMKYENLTFYESLQELARKANVELKDVKLQDQAWEKKEVLFKINKLASEYYKHILHKTPIGAKAKEYLLKRGLNEKIIETFHIGYAPSSWESLYKFLKSRKFSDIDIARTGLVVKGNRGYYDRFRARIIFPIFDVRDNIIAFSGRLLENKPNDPKYINISETEIYHKRESLYGIHVAKDEIRKQDIAILVEGEFDVIMPYQQGIGNIVAVKGSAVTKDHLKILKRFAKRVILCLDADAAGRDAVVKAVKEAEDVDVEVYVMQLTEGKDPDEAVQKNEGAFKHAIKQSIPAYDFLIDQVKQKYPEDNPFDKKKMCEELLPYLNIIKNPIVKEHYVKLVAEAADTSVESLRILMDDFARKQLLQRTVHAVAEETAKKEDPLEAAQTHLMAYLLQHDEPLSVLKLIEDVITPNDFTMGSYQVIVSTLLEYSTKETVFNVNSFGSLLPPEVNAVYNQLLLKPMHSHEVAHEDPRLRAFELKYKLLQYRLDKYNKREESEENDRQIQAISEEMKRINVAKNIYQSGRKLP